MWFALGAASAALNALQSLTSSSKSSSDQSGIPFSLLAGAGASGPAGAAVPGGGPAQISSPTMSALIDAQGQQGADDLNTDPLTQALDGASSSSVTNSDGSTTTTITYADGSKATTTTPAPDTNSASSSYNRIEQMMQREAQAMSSHAAAALSIHA
jgi:hypothetical protein